MLLAPLGSMLPEFTSSLCCGFLDGTPSDICLTWEEVFRLTCVALKMLKNNGCGSAMVDCVNRSY